MKNNHVNDEDKGLILGPYGEIPKRLREYYDSIQDQALPDRFLDLLEQLDRAEKAAVIKPVEPEGGR